VIVLDAQFELSAPNLASAPKADLPEFCFVGRSNVGKSSALNVLTARRQLARVSKTPGRTRMLNFFKVTLADRPGTGHRVGTLRLCDLPGYGFAKAPKQERVTWDKTVSTYLNERESLTAVVALIDAEVGAQPKDLAMFDFLAKSGRQLIVVATKADRLPRTRRGSALDRIAHDLAVPRAAMIPFSSHEAIGHDELWRALCAAAGLFDRQSDRIIEPAVQTPPEAGPA
jgi:GTP-binding protein